MEAKQAEPETVSRETPLVTESSTLATSNSPAVPLEILPGTENAAFAETNAPAPEEHNLPTEENQK
jgi:hypothetical protein